MPDIYQQALTAARFNQLRPLLQLFHHGRENVRVEGSSRVRHGRSRVNRLAAKILGLPQPGQWPLRLCIEQRGNRQWWLRDFGGIKFTTRQWHDDGLVVERVGWMQLALRLDECNGRLVYRLAFCRLFGIRLPAILAPRVHAWETASVAQLAFCLDIYLPWTGRLIAYSGRLRWPG